MDNLIDKVSIICAKHFNIDERDLYSSTRKEDMVLARHFSWYILHVDYGISTGILCKEFFKTRRQVFSAINKIRNGIDKQKFYQELYESLKRSIEERKV